MTRSKTTDLAHVPAGAPRILVRPAAVGVTIGAGCLVLAAMVPAALLLPVLAVMSIAAAGGIALVAWLVRAERRTDGVNAWDAAGACALIGAAAGTMTRPDHVLQLFGYALVAQ